MVWPQPKVIAITFINLVARYADIKVVGFVLVEQYLACFGKHIVWGDTEPDGV